MAYLETSYSEKKGPWKVLAVFLLLTLLAAGTGGLLGMHILDVAERMIEEQRAQPKVPTCLLYTSPSPRDGLLSRMPSSA